MGGYEEIFSLLQVQHQNVLKLFPVRGQCRSTVFINIHTHLHHQISHCRVWVEREGGRGEGRGGGERGREMVR